MLDEGSMAEARAETYAAGKRSAVCSFAECCQLPLLGRTMEGLWRAQAQAERKVGFRGKEERKCEPSNREFGPHHFETAVDTELVRGMNSPVQQVNIAMFSIEVDGVSIIFLLEYSTAQRAYSLEHLLS